jgi:hypothetical protein
MKVLPIDQFKSSKNIVQIGIPKFLNRHHSENFLIGIYFIDMDSNDRYYKNISHEDWYSVQNDHSVHINPKFSLEKKILVQGKEPTGVDINFILPSSHNNIRFFDFIPSNFKRYYFNDGNISAIPLVKLFEICEEIYFKYIDYLVELSDIKYESAEKIDELFYNSLYKTESNPILKIENEKCLKFYSNYNPYTITNRPTNSSGGINFTALSKKDDTRKNIVAGDGNVFVQFDYAAFHPYLISKILNINIPEKIDYYIWLNETFNFSESSDRNKIKEDLFKMIYGYTKQNNEFSNKIDEFEEKLAQEYISKSSITSFFLKRELFFKSGLNNNVLFNYFLQNMETEYNLLKLKQILEQIPNELAALTMYVYDSFIFTIPINSIDIIADIKDILIKEKFPVKIYMGENLQDLQLIN